MFTGYAGALAAESDIVDLFFWPRSGAPESESIAHSYLNEPEVTQDLGILNNCHYLDDVSKTQNETR
jgi:hypothetical protein